MANGILKYTSRDYDSIKTDLIDSISSLTNIWTSREESDPGIVLIKEMSALGDMLSYNFDKQALEYYAPTVTQRKNASKLFNLVGYNMHWYQSAITTVTLTYTPEIDDEWFTYCIRVKNAVDAKDEDELLNIYYEYRSKYIVDKNSSASAEHLSIPPIINESGTEIVAPSWVTIPYSERVWVIHSEPYSSLDTQVVPEDIKSNRNFKINALTFFKNIAINIFNEFEPLGIHTYINDVNRSLEIYSSDSSNVVYSLIPMEPTSQDIINYPTLQYPPSVKLYPYTPQTFTAVQGYIGSVTFTSSQLNNGRFYLSESAVDDTYMYLSYNSTIQSTADKKVGFGVKTDNLLTIDTVQDDGGNDILYFQFGIDDYDYPYIELVSYWKNMFPESSVSFTLYYFKTLGASGNISTNYLSRLSSTNSNIVNVKNVDTNTSVYDSNGDILSMPGSNPQTAYEAYVDSINYIMTYNTLVTPYDFIRFTRRQHGISNATVVDIQRSEDLNTKTLKICNSYSKEQIENILGIDGSGMSENQMRQVLYSIQKIYSNYRNCPVYGISVDIEDDFLIYSANIYPIYNDYVTMESILGEDPVEVATYTNESTYPYYLYKIHTSDDGSSADQYKIETALNKAYNNVHICSIKPSYSALRVFQWRCCCVLHLTKSVSSSDANQIIENVITYLSLKYSPNNVEIGKKISYMDVIQTIMDSDDRIRYVDAGVGTKKLIEFDDILDKSVDHYKPEAYFNPISIMRYVQSYATNSNKNSSFYNYISIDPTYIQGGIL